MLKMRENVGLELPRIIVMFENNSIRTLQRDKDMKWQYEENQELRMMPGKVTHVIHSVKSSSLLLLRHKLNNSSKSNLAMFYFKDQEDQSRWNVMEDLEDHQRVFQISLSNKFMTDLSMNKPMIGVYDDQMRKVTVYRLEAEK